MPLHGNHIQVLTSGGYTWFHIQVLTSGDPDLFSEISWDKISLGYAG